jgi:hypothetical protein
MKQSSRVYTGLVIVAFGAVLFAYAGFYAYAVTPIGLVVFGCVQVFVGSVSALSVGDRTFTLRHLLAAESAVGGVLFGVVSTVLVLTRVAPGSSPVTDSVVLVLGSSFSAWMLFNAYQLSRGVTPTGYLEVEANVDRELHL